MRHLPKALQRHRAMAREVVLFLVIGVGNTLLFFVVYNVLRAVMTPLQANAVAVTTGALASFWANRRYTFRVRGRDRLARQLVEFGIVFGVTLLLSSAALKILLEIDPQPSRLAENVALLLGSGVAVTARFLLLRHWVFHPRRHSSPQAEADERILV